MREIPNTSIESIEESGYKHEIYNMLCSNISPSRVSRLISVRYGYFIAPQDIHKFLKLIPEAHILEPTKLMARLDGLEVETDSIVELMRVVRVMDERLDILLDVEGANGPPSPEVDRAATTLFDLHTRLIAVQQSLGLLPTKAERVEILNRNMDADEDADDGFTLEGFIRERRESST